MNAHLVLLTVLAFAVGSSAHVTALGAQKASDAKKKEQVCWPGEPEIQNPNPGKHRPSRLPPEFANAKVQRSVMLLKLCVSETGDVARVLVLQSSGNPDVDKYYMTELSKWTFTPAERERRRVRSFVPVAVTLYIK
jgi:TonB family protein